LRALAGFYRSLIALSMFEFYFILPRTASIGSQRIAATPRIMKILLFLKALGFRASGKFKSLFPIGALPPGRAEALETLGINLGILGVLSTVDRK